LCCATVRGAVPQPTPRPLTPAGLAPGDLPAAEFQSLVDKTNLYVRALNAVVGAQRTYDRYASWVDVKKGPTGKERYITYGLYPINSSQVEDIRKAADRGSRMKPALPELDDAVQRLAESFSALEPLVNRASDYYEQEDWKDDNAKGGQELHARMMPLFDQVFAAERELRAGLDTMKMQVDRRQLAEIEKRSGRGYEWHLRNFMIAAKGVINLLPESADAAPISASAYTERHRELEIAYSGFQSFASESPEEVKKVPMASFVETAVKDYFAASKSLRRVLEAPKLDRREYVTRAGELAKTYNDLIQRTNSMR
jgi:hypothetical protein